MARALNVNDTLRKLRLRRNKITDEGSRALANVLPEHFRLLEATSSFADPPSFELDLEENNVGVDGALSLAQSLQLIGDKADVEILLFGNTNVERGALRRALAEAGADPAAADDPRLKIELSKAEHL